MIIYYVQALKSVPGKFGNGKFVAESLVFPLDGDNQDNVVLNTIAHMIEKYGKDNVKVFSAFHDVDYRQLRPEASLISCSARIWDENDGKAKLLWEAFDIEIRKEQEKEPV